MLKKLRDLKPGDKFLYEGKKYQAIKIFDATKEDDSIVYHAKFTDKFHDTYEEDRVYTLDLQTFRVCLYAVDEEIDQEVETVD
jgi:hypothetical protein